MKRGTIVIVVLATILVLVIAGCTTGRAALPPPRPSGGYPVGGGCGVGAPADIVIDVNEGVALAVERTTAA
ncbi:MAG: hypothetical protein AABY13_06020 [Nanoarchaeota archaeon]